MIVTRIGLTVNATKTTSECGLVLIVISRGLVRFGSVWFVLLMVITVIVLMFDCARTDADGKDSIEWMTSHSHFMTIGA